MTKELAAVNPEVAEILEKMEPRHVTLLILKILSPGSTLQDLARQVWPDLKYDMIRRHIADSGVRRVIEYVSRRPYQLGLVLNSKMMPLAIATLYAGLSAPKDNVRISAAKEIVKLAQASASKLYPDDNEPPPTDELDAALREAEDAEEGEEESS